MFTFSKSNKTKVYEGRNQVQDELMTCEMFNVYKKISEDDEQLSKMKSQLNEVQLKNLQAS